VYALRPVDELIAAQDNALALLNGGDELTLQFAAQSLPQSPPDDARFSFSTPWLGQRTADFHCELGLQVEPLPWHGMEEQL